MNKLKRLLTKGIRIRVGHYTHELEYEMKEVFIGHRTIFSVLGFIIGGLLIARSIWEYLTQHFSLWAVILIGIIIFMFSGIILHEFHDSSDPKKKKQRLSDIV